MNISSNRFLREIIRKYSSMIDFSNDLYSKPVNYIVDGKLNKSSIKREVNFPILFINKNHLGIVSKIFKKFYPELQRFKSFIDSSDNTQKGLVFDPTKVKKIQSELTEAHVAKLKELKINYFPTSFVYKTFVIDYDNFNAYHLIKWLITDDVQFVSSYTNIGHIIHLNLREEHDQYKFAIGEILIDKIPTAKTVVSKVNQIENEFRTLQLEVIAGENNFETFVKQDGIEFHMDFSKVFWNSRLSTEHRRLFNIWNESDVVYDACAGIGPFVIPAAKKGINVIANDLNSDSIKWLNVNKEKNSSKKRKLQFPVYNIDAKEFVKTIVIPDIMTKSSLENAPGRFFLVMNLPDKAIEFLSSIKQGVELFLTTSRSSLTTVLLHIRCYCFVTRSDESDLNMKVITDKIRQELTGLHIVTLNMRKVRDVSGQKDMFCAEVTVDLLASNESFISVENIEPKRRKLNGDNS